MNNDRDNPDPSSSSSSGRFLETVRPLRDLESNWTVDLAKNLEEYLLKICSGQIPGDEDAIFSVNFAEAALLLQGSVQVYSRKVEYLYSLVLQALNFISQKSQEDQTTSASPQAGASGVHTVEQEEDDPFWISDDLPVDSKNLLDNATSRAGLPNHFVRPPANLVVLEGECLDSGGDAGELDSYLLATADLYRDFILLDPCDAVAVDNFLDSNSGKGPTYKGSALTSKGRKGFQSPWRHSGQKASAQKNQDANFNKSPCVNRAFEFNDSNVGHCPPAYDFCADPNDGFQAGDGYSEHGDFNGNSDDDDKDEDDPWKPLNPHEPGNLKVKPYKKVNPRKRVDFNSKKQVSLAAEFPLAKLNGLINDEQNEIWEAKFGALIKHQKSHSVFEKLRQSLVEGDIKTKDAFSSHENNAEDDGYDSEDQDAGPPDFDIPDNTSNNENNVPFSPQKHEEADADENLEDLCRSHLDALLATLAENEKQTELATRVSTWKQRIEKNLEEQDARPPFDIHKYGDRVLEKLSTEGDGKSNSLSFVDVVKGQEKHDVARTFSALLQLVNNGDVDLVNNGSDDTVTCYTEMNPFYVRLLKRDIKKGIQLQPSKKRTKSTLLKGHSKSKNSKGKENIPVATNSSPERSSSNGRFPVNLGTHSRGSKCTPEGKKRRKSRATVAPLGMHFVG